jgi:hypothetical protein
MVGNRSLFGEIRRIPAGYALAIHPGFASEHQVWAPALGVSLAHSPEEAAEKIAFHLVESCHGLLASISTVLRKTNDWATESIKRN